MALNDLSAYADVVPEYAKFKDGRIDHASLSRRLKRCDLNVCKGMCCYDGVYLSEAAAHVLDAVFQEYAGFFASHGIGLTNAVIRKIEAGAEVYWKTETVPHPFSTLVRDYPSNFNDTACAFMVKDGRCSLQLLAEHTGHHRWFYKPVGCWRHPITRGPTDDVILFLAGEEHPHPNYDDYVPLTQCGKTEPDGEPASSLLSEEIEFLSALFGRDLGCELENRTDDARGPQSDRESSRETSEHRR
jgi:hypothetical protein